MSFYIFSFEISTDKSTKRDRERIIPFNKYTQYLTFYDKLACKGRWQNKSDTPTQTSTSLARVLTGHPVHPAE